MGYYTYYELYAEPLSRSENIRAELDAIRAEPFPDAFEDAWVAAQGGATYGHLLDGELGDMKWYDCFDDMCALSAKYPDWLFEIRGYGEARKDVWGAWFHKGRYYEKDARILWPAFYPAYLHDLPGKHEEAF